MDTQQSYHIFEIQNYTLRSHLRIFHLYGDVKIRGEWFDFVVYTLHSWPVRSEGSLSCQAYCNTEQSFMMIIFEDAW